MAEALYLVKRTVQGVNEDRNKVREVVINNDDGDSDATILQNTVDALNTANTVTGPKVYPDGYFDSVNKLSDLVTASVLRTSGDFIAFPPRVDAVNT